MESKNSTSMADAILKPMVWVLSDCTRTLMGPSNWSRSTTSSIFPILRPRSCVFCSMAGSSMMKRANARRCIWRQIRKRLQVPLQHNAVAIGNGIAVGIVTGVAQLAGDCLYKTVRNGMLERLRFIVYLMQLIAQIPHEIGFDQAMTPQDLQRQPLALVGEAHTAILEVIYSVLPLPGAAPYPSPPAP